MKIAECAALLVTACLVSKGLGCASASRKGLLIKAERLHERGEHTAAMEQLDLLMTTSSPPPEMRSQVIYTRARWVEERGELAEAAFLYRHVVRHYPDSPSASAASARLSELGCSAETESPVPLCEAVKAP